MIKAAKDTRNLLKGSGFVSLPLPLTAEEIQHQLFEFAEEDTIYLYFPKNEKNNFHLFFNNHEFGDHTNLYIGFYPYFKFIDKNPEECKKFAKEIFEEIEKLRKEE